MFEWVFYECHMSVISFRVQAWDAMAESIEGEFDSAEESRQIKPS